MIGTAPKRQFSLGRVLIGATALSILGLGARYSLQAIETHFENKKAETVIEQRAKSNGNLQTRIASARNLGDYPSYTALVNECAKKRCADSSTIANLVVSGKTLERYWNANNSSASKADALFIEALSPVDSNSVALKRFIIENPADSRSKQLADYFVTSPTANLLYTLEIRSKPSDVLFYAEKLYLATSWLQKNGSALPERPHRAVQSIDSLAREPRGWQRLSERETQPAGTKVRVVAKNSNGFNKDYYEEREANFHLNDVGVIVASYDEGYVVRFELPEGSKRKISWKSDWSYSQNLSAKSDPLLADFRSSELAALLPYYAEDSARLSILAQNLKVLYAPSAPERVEKK